MTVAEMAAVLAKSGFTPSRNHRPGSTAKEMWIRRIEGAPPCFQNRHEPELHVYLHDEFRRGDVVLAPTFDVEVAMGLYGAWAVLRLYGFSRSLTVGLVDDIDRTARQTLKALVEAQPSARLMADRLGPLPEMTPEQAAKYAAKKINPEHYSHIVLGGDDCDVTEKG